MSYIVNNNCNILNNKIYAEGQRVPYGFFLLSDASKKCSYSQEYLSLLARRGELKAMKFGRNWYTSLEWLRDYTASHSVTKHGNFKGEIVSDKIFVSKIAASHFNQSVGSFMRGLYDFVSSFFIGLALRVTKSVAVLFAFVKSFFNFQRMSKSVEDDSNIFVEEKKILKNQLVIDNAIFDIVNADADLISKIEIVFGHSVSRAKKTVERFPFAEDLNGQVMDNALAVMESLIENVSVNFFKWFAKVIIDRLCKIIFLARVEFFSLLRKPRLIFRHYRAFSFYQKVGAGAYYAVILFLLFISFSSVFFVDKVGRSYTSVEYQVGIKISSLKNGLDNLNLRLGNIAQSFGSKATMGKIDFSKGVAGVRDVNLSKIAIQKSEDFFADINDWTNSFLSNLMLKNAESRVAGGLAPFFSALAKLANVSAEFSGMVDRQFDKNLIAALPGVISREEFRLKSLNPFFDSNISLEVDDQFMRPGASLNFLITKIDENIGGKNNLIYRQNEDASRFLVEKIVGNVSQLPQLDGRKAISYARTAGGKTQIALRNYLESLNDPRAMILADQTGKYTKLQKLFIKAKYRSAKVWEIASDYAAKYVDHTRDRLGNGYLALLDTLNLEPAYTDYRDRRLLEGVGDEPLRLEGNAESIDDAGLAIIPLGNNNYDRTKIIEQIKNSFSDEVEVAPDKDTASGIIKPVDGEIPFEQYMYVVVPIKGKEAIN